MAAAAAPPVPIGGPEESSSLPGLLPRPAVAISWDSQALHSHAERSEMELKACVIDPTRLPTLESLLQEMYASLRPKPVDYEHRHLMIDVFNRIAEQIFGKKNGLPVVEAFGSFTMDLFTPKSDLDLSVNFNTDTKDLYPRKNKINAIRKLSKVLYSHQSQGRCHGVLPIATARVPVLKVIDQGTGVECDISIENKDGMSRSIIIKFISSIDERFRVLCYLMKFWAKAHNVNSPKDQTMSSMAIISLVAFHLQTRSPPILPAFSAVLKDGSDFASIEKNVSLLEGFGGRNKESIAELFVSLMIKLVSVEGLWQQGLCASNFEGSWISKTWERGVGNLSVEDFLDQSQNFARAVGVGQMRKICECLRATVSDLSKFFMGKIAAAKLKALLFGGPLNQVNPVSYPSQKTVKRKRVNPNKTSKKKKRPLEQDKPVISPGQQDDKKPLDQKPVSSPIQKDAKKKKPLDQVKPVISPGQKDDKREKPLEQDKAVISPGKKDDKREKPLDQDKPAISRGQKDGKNILLNQAKPAISPGQRDDKKKPLDQSKPAISPGQKDDKKKKPLDQDKAVISPVQKDAKKSSNVGRDSGNSHVQQKKAKVTVYTSGSRPTSVSIPPQRMHGPVFTQPMINQFAHIPQHLITPPAFGYGLPPPWHLHSAYHHPRQGFVGQPQGDLLNLYTGFQLQHPGQAMFGPPAAHRPVLNGFRPYGINGAQQAQHIDNGLVQRLPYGMGPGSWR
ncbi:Protein HESO1 [Dichanthelium oligosanthes]|uniref:Protein HESO1 n=1 Tax=Dichanthelium oligosanthes TaxID=888268 RepID=A0A1E5VUI5_9POAL|nr:Protein HESO1 [Dichanthelium oligosanthes]